jgi:hypothetical protein
MLIPIGFFGGAPDLKTYEQIATANGTGSSATITFGSIPQTYKHLEIRMVTQDTNSSNRWLSGISLQFNGDTAANYAYHYLVGSAGSVSSSGGTAGTDILLRNVTTGTFTSGIHGSTLVSVLDYTNTSKNTTVRYLGGAYGHSENGVSFGSGHWRNTNAITSISIVGAITAFTTSSRFTLYGIKG